MIVFLFGAAWKKTHAHDVLNTVAKALYHAGLRGIGFDEVVCGPGTQENGACAIRAQYDGTAVLPISLFIKATAQKVRSLAASEMYEHRQLFLCCVCLVVQSILIICRSIVINVAPTN
jgi:hypothetical protein